jgi:cytochrome c oxidase subunit II
MRDAPHGKRFLITFIVLSVIATPLVAIFVGDQFPPGNATAQAHEQVFDNSWLVAIMTPPSIFVLVFLAYVLTTFRNRTGELVDGPPVRGDARIQTWWMVVTGVIVLFLAGFGSYELVQSGSGGGQGPTAAFQPAGYTKAMDVQVIAQQWEFTYRYPTYGGVEVPRLVLPANTLVRLHVTSLDAIHSFWAYQLGVRRTRIPGATTSRTSRRRARSRSTSIAPSCAASGTATCSTRAKWSTRAHSRAGSSASARTSRR